LGALLWPPHEHVTGGDLSLGMRGTRVRAGPGACKIPASARVQAEVGDELGRLSLWNDCGALVRARRRFCFTRQGSSRRRQPPLRPGGRSFTLPLVTASLTAGPHPQADPQPARRALATAQLPHLPRPTRPGLPHPQRAHGRESARRAPAPRRRRADLGPGHLRRAQASRREPGRDPVHRPPQHRRPIRTDHPGVQPR
jgi:hypothetical protein